MAKTPNIRTTAGRQADGDPQGRDAITEFTSNPELMRRVNALAQQDPRLADIRAQLLRSASGEPQDAQQIISASITVLTDMVIRGDKDVGGEALKARDEVIEIAQGIPFKQSPRRR